MHTPPHHKISWPRLGLLIYTQHRVKSTQVSPSSGRVSSRSKRQNSITWYTTLVTIRRCLSVYLSVHPTKQTQHISSHPPSQAKRQVYRTSLCVVYCVIIIASSLCGCCQHHIILIHIRRNVCNRNAKWYIFCFYLQFLYLFLVNFLPLHKHTGYIHHSNLYLIY